jgi:hypothetical protein
MQRASALEQVIRNNAEILQKNIPAWIRLNYFAAKMYYQLDKKYKGRLTFLRILSSKPLHLLAWKQFVYLELYGPTAVRGKQLLADI